MLSTTAIILHDIIAAIPRKRKPAQTTSARRKLTGHTRDEIEILARRIRRSLQRPASFRAMRKEVAETIVSAALAAKGSPVLRTTSHELIREILSDPEVVQFVEEQLSEETMSDTLRRREIGIEFERMATVLGKAASELA